MGAKACFFQRLAGAAMESDKVLPLKRTGSRERLRHQLGFDQLAIDRQKLGTDRLERIFFELDAFVLVHVEKQGNSTEHAREQAGEDQPK
ncbi:hypothetical protein [Rhodoferax sp. UBA5149]|uniref:hypothetical protein n=1 Tax=Rhodoferax sp. UBA5149 TaxID=1947379 RepID=UPI0025DF97BB|nr:hypothetical protein [Rhodoferax sp. UBA5149]